MPKQKIRQRRAPRHYNENAGVIQGEPRREMMKQFGLTPRRVINRKDMDVRKARRARRSRPAFLGSVITSSNYREFVNQQASAFKERFIQNVVEQREKVKNQEDKTPEEIDIEVRAFNEDQPSHEQLEVSALRFGKFQARKEHKHLTAYTQGRARYAFGPHLHPVITQDFIDQTKSYKEVVNIDQTEEE